MKKGTKVTLDPSAKIRVAPRYAFHEGTNIQSMAITDNMYIEKPNPHAGKTGTVVALFDGGLVDVRWGTGEISTEIESQLKEYRINRKSFAKAAAQLSHDDYNEVVVYDPDTNEFSVSNRTYANQVGEVIIMNGDTGYDPTDMTTKDFYDFFMSKSFDWQSIELAVEEALADL